MKILVSKHVPYNPNNEKSLENNYNKREIQIKKLRNFGWVGQN